jgi:hypothetical protein
MCGTLVILAGKQLYDVHSAPVEATQLLGSVPTDISEVPVPVTLNPEQLSLRITVSKLFASASGVAAFI